jgi:hypothetical protein
MASPKAIVTPSSGAHRPGPASDPFWAGVTRFSQLRVP